MTMRRHIEEWIAKARARKAEKELIKKLSIPNEDWDSPPVDSSGFVALGKVLPGGVETMEMGEVTGAFQMVSDKIESVTEAVKETQDSAKRIINSIGVLPGSGTSSPG